MGKTDPGDWLNSQKIKLLDLRDSGNAQSWLKIERSRLTMSQWTNSERKYAVCLCLNIVSLEEENFSSFHNRNGFGGEYTKWNKTHTWKIKLFHDLTFMNNLGKTYKIQTENKRILSVKPGGGRKWKKFIMKQIHQIGTAKTPGTSESWSWYNAPCSRLLLNYSVWSWEGKISKIIGWLHLFLTLFNKIKITKSGKLNKSWTLLNSNEALLAERWQ